MDKKYEGRNKLKGFKSFFESVKWTNYKNYLLKVDYKRDKNQRQREKERVTQLYSSITTEDAYNAAAVNYNELPPHEQAYRNSLQPPQVNNSGRPSMTVNQRSASCDESVTVHDLRKQSVNLLRYESSVSNC